MNEIEKFKEFLRETMLNNFKKDGYLAPVVFFLAKGTPLVKLIPEEYLGSYEGKKKLSNTIKEICKDKDIQCAGIIIEAFAKAVTPDSELGNLLMNGNMRVSELKEKEDVIIMVFCTPDQEVTHTYIVDPKTKTVGKEMFASSVEHENSSHGGVFSNFFELRKG